MSIRIVLVRPAHPGNIGSAARAMKTMGLEQLWLVAPERFPADEAVVLSAGAEDVLANARVVPDYTRRHRRLRADRRHDGALAAFAMAYRRAA